MKIIFLSLFLISAIYFSNCSLLFKLKDTEPQCLGGDYMENSIIVIKYKIFTPSRKNLTQILPYITLFMKNSNTNIKLNNEHIFMNKGKFTFKTKDAGIYEICIQSNRYSVIHDLGEDLFVNLKIVPDYYVEESTITNPINSEDINSVNQKTRQIVGLTRPIIDNQQQQLEVENEHSLKTLSNASFYKYLTFGQLIITIIIGLIQVNNFRRFLKSLNLI